MTAKVSDYRNHLYSRDYSNDAPPQTDLAKRVALAAVPFLSLHRHFRFPVSVIMGTLRVWNTDWKDIPGATMAVVALAGSFFQHRAAMVMTTAHDILIEINKIRNGSDWEEVSKSLVKILSHLIYLALITRGGLELSLIAFMMQAVINLIQSRDEFKNGRWIEGVSNLLMAGIRLHQTHGQYQQLKRNWEIDAAIRKISVGELHEKWRFPSDHLPVGIEVNGVRIISWNVLNNAYMEWVTDKDSQGLNGSLISDLNVVVQENGLTQRDIFVADMVQNMMAQGQIVALQECSEPFLQHLQGRLPSSWDIVRSFNAPRVDQDVILYNKAQLTYQSALSETTRSAYPSVPGRPLQNAWFSNREGRDLRIINSHIPGDPDKPGREELARYVQQQHKQGPITIALGDNNFEREEMIDAFRKAGFTDFSLHSPWKTNIDPVTKQSKGIDHMFVIGDDNSRDLKPAEVLVGGNLQETIELLNRADKPSL
jgi:endonuclease/exonuclease/phosphatase family metal-dependent hydrolase